MPLYPPAGSGGGAPTTVEYLVGATDGTLSAERVVTDTTGADGVTWDLATGGQAKARATNGGKWVKLATATASASATIDFTGLDSSYNAYLVVLSNVQPATDGVDLWLRTSTNNGVSYDAGAGNYNWGNFISTTAAGTAAGGSTSDTKIKVNQQTLSNVANEELCGHLFIYRPSAAKFCRVAYQVNYIRADASVDALCVGGGARLTAADVDAIRFLMSSGNIASGQFDLYGLSA